MRQPEVFDAKTDKQLPMTDELRAIVEEYRSLFFEDAGGAD
jgi:hypothetical protein